MTLFLIALLFSAHPACYGSTPDHRDSAHKRAFTKEHPCPGGPDKGSSKRCAGYVVDHICPLECCGLDHKSNMQWQTVKAGKIKDRWEGHCARSCKHSVRRKP